MFAENDRGWKLEWWPFSMGLEVDKKHWSLKSFTENIRLAQYSWTPTCFSYSRRSVRISAMMRGWRLKWRLWGGWEGQVSVGSISLLQCQQFLVRFWVITRQYLWYTLDVLFQIIPFMSDQFQLCLHTIDFSFTVIDSLIKTGLAIRQYLQEGDIALLVVKFLTPHWRERSRGINTVALFSIRHQ